MKIVFDFLALAGLVVISLFRMKAAEKSSFLLYPRCFPLAWRRPAIVFWVIGLLAFFTSVLATLFIGIPQPAIHDEFSYLLAADTFTLGRLANPTHPLWEHFESFHIIQHPTYASKFPPAQGLALAFGQYFFGLPIVGVWLSVALASAATCWMLAGWCPLRWAWMGGLITVVRLVFSGPFFTGDLESTAYWSQSYWGGAVAALGGALVFGSLPRIIKNNKGPQALWLGLGMAILANSRPFEGLVASIPVLWVLVIWLARAGREFQVLLFRRIVAPSVVVILLTLSWMMYYNSRVTGDPLRMAYQEHDSTYMAAPVFLWQPLNASQSYRHQILKTFHIGWFLQVYQKQQSFFGWIRWAISKLRSIWLFFVGILFTPFVAALPHMWHRKKVRFALVVCGMMMAALLTVTWTFPHYAAPVTCLIIFLLVESLRQARFAKWRGWPIGKSIVRTFLPMLLFSAIVPLALAQPLKQSGWQMERARVLRTLECTPERHLVIVRYGPDHSPHEEWVYNRADIDASRVVWARAMNPEADKALLDYFQDRRIWILQVDHLKHHLAPYSSDSSTE